jgi:hypothetical protein
MERRPGFTTAILLDIILGHGRSVQTRAKREERLPSSTGHVSIPEADFNAFGHERSRVVSRGMSMREATRGRGVSDDQETLPIYEVDSEQAEDLETSTSLFGPGGLNAFMARTEER